jgi:hypothetical protein
MQQTRFRNLSQVKRSGGSLPLLLCAAFLNIGLSGCKQTGGDFNGTSTEAASLEATVSDAEKSKATELVKTFTAAIQTGDEASLRKMMTPNLQARALPLQEWLKEKQFAPLFGAKDWEYPLVRYSGRGKTLVVGTRFNASDGGSYTTNFAFKKSGDSWLLDQILPPTMPRKPSQSPVKPQ